MVTAFKDNIQPPRKHFFLFRLRSKFHILSAEEVEYFLLRSCDGTMNDTSVLRNRLEDEQNLKMVNKLTGESGVHIVAAIVTLSKESHILLTRITLGRMRHRK
jgi:hypothetical protein